MTREIFPEVHQGDRLGARHVNDLSQVARNVSGRGGGSFLSTSGGQPANQSPFIQRVVKIIRIRFEPSDDDDESSESSFSSSSSISTSSSISSSSISSSASLRRYYTIQPMYYEFSSGTWQLNADEGTFDLDASAFPGAFNVGDVVEAWWDPQREAYISKPSSVSSNDGGCESQNAIIDIILPGRPINGTFTLTWTITSTEIKTFNWDDDAADFATTLATHGGIPSPGDIEVTAGPLPNATIRVEFKNALKNRDIPLPTGNWTNLGGGSGVGIICAYAQRGHS